MAWPDDPRDLKVGFAFGHNDAEDPSGLTFEVVSPNEGDEGDPGPVLQSLKQARGRIGDASTTDATQIALALRDSDGDFSPRNVSGQYYGQLRNGTPVQTAVDVGSGDVVLGTAFVPEWNPTWTGPDMDDQVAINAQGLLAKVGRDREVKSAIKRTILASNLVAYWPLEDGFDASVASGGVPNAAPLRVVGTITFADDETLPGSKATPDMSQGALLGTVKGGSSTAWFVEFWLKADFSAGSRAAYILTSSSGLATWGIRQPASASGQFDVFVSDSTGALNESLAFSVSGWTEDWHHIAITAEQDGANVNVFMYGDGALLSGTQILSETLGAVTGVAINDFDSFSFADVLSAAHLVVGDGDTPTNSYAAGDGYSGEEAATRIDRLCDEEGIPAVSFGDSTVMGPQKPGDILSVLRECEAADHGVLYERRDGRLGYQPRTARYNLPVSLALQYGSEEDPDADISDLQMFDDNRDLYNLITVTRVDGSSVTAELETGPVGTDETEGVGPRPLPVTLNLASDSQLANHAGWLLRAGTVDKPRFVLVLDLYAKPSIAASVLACDVGSRITVTGAPAKHVGPDDLDLIIEGEVLDFDATRGLVMWWCEPYDLWNVGEIDGPGVLDNLGSETAEEVVAGETEIDVTNSDVGYGVVSWSSSGVPYEVVIGGEPMTVTSVSGTGASQTLTVTRTVSKTHPSGSAVRAYHPLRIAL